MRILEKCRMRIEVRRKCAFLFKCLGVPLREWAELDFIVIPNPAGGKISQLLIKLIIKS
jgi:hypothetical protein